LQGSFVPYVTQSINKNVRVARPTSYEKQLAAFLRQRRGELTFREFARKVGLSASSLQRLELGEQNVTLKTIKLITERLKVPIREIFPE